MKSILILAVLLMTSVNSWASSFVGNGGNIGDVELEVAIRQLTSTLNQIAKPEDNSQTKLCTCYSEFEGRASCKALKQLNDQQVNFCATFLNKKAQEMSSLLSQRSHVSFNWTQKSIEVTENGRIREADAVTDPETKKITLNQTRFLSMNPSERTFLIAHEIFHLAQLDGKYLSDQGSIGPFAGMDGGRQFINSMSTSIVVESYRLGTFEKFNKILYRSQAIKPLWINFGLQSLMIPSNSGNPYLIDNSSGAQLGIRYQFSDWGVLLDYSLTEGQKDILSTTKGKEQRQIIGMGIGYRWFPFEDPTTFAGQTHLLFTLKFEQLQATYKLSDPYVSSEERANSEAVALGANYFIPLRRDFWLYAGMGYSNHQYEFAQLKSLDTNAQYKNNNVSFTLGASYAF